MGKLVDPGDDGLLLFFGVVVPFKNCSNLSCSCSVLCPDYCKGGVPINA
jgi:hypothetical protein